MFLMLAGLGIAGCPEDFGWDDPLLRNGFPTAIEVQTFFRDGASYPGDVLEPGMAVHLGRKGVAIKKVLVFVEGKLTYELGPGDFYLDRVSQGLEEPAIWNLDESGLMPMTFEEAEKRDKQ